MQSANRLWAVGGALVLVLSVGRCQPGPGSSTDPPQLDLGVPVEPGDPTGYLAPAITSILPARATNLGGKLLAIYGKNFQRGATITIGGKPCDDPALVSQTLLTCTLPAIPKTCGPAEVRVINPDGQTATDATNFFLLPAGVQLALKTSYELPIRSTDAGSADFNGDGIPDLVATHTDFLSFSVFMGKGDGTFQPSVTYAFPGKAWAIGPFVGDFNGDGKPDVLVTYGKPGGVSLFPGRGDGTFEPEVSTMVDSTAYPAVIGDLNGDDILDAVLPPTTTSEVRVLLGTRSGRFSELAPFHNPTGVPPGFVRLADMNGDRKLDIVIVDEVPADVSIGLGNGDGTFQTGRYVLTLPPLVYGAVLEDLNGDQRADFLVSGALLGVFSVLLSDHTGTPKPTVDVELPAGQDSTTFSTPDLNQDGAPDILMCTGNSSIAALVYLEAKVAGRDYASQWVLPIEGGADSMTFRDWNGDQLLDVATTNISGFNVGVNEKYSLQIFLQQCN